MAYNTILLKGELANIEEVEAYEAITPGMLVELRAGYNTLRKHAGDDAFVTPWFALESELEGKGITDAYAAGDQVRVWHPRRGEQVYALVADGENIAIGDKLSSNGDGYLREYAGESVIEEAGAIVAIAREAVNRSTSSGGDTNTTGRIVVEVV